MKICEVCFCNVEYYFKKCCQLPVHLPNVIWYLSLASSSCSYNWREFCNIIYASQYNLYISFNYFLCANLTVSFG